MKQTLILLVILALTYSSCKKETVVEGSSPVATFKADKTIVTESETVQFADQSANTPTTWSWNFGDGSTSTSQNPTHTYNTGGNYTVSLTATNSYGSDTESKTDYITVEYDINWGDGVTDYDGNTYNTVIIGTQEWMAEDLKVTHYPNGNAIPHVTDNTIWGNLEDNNTDDAYCFYNNNSGTDYGALYTYAAAIGDDWARDNADGQGVCPDGWHLPSDAERTELTDYLGGTSVAGGILKETGTTHWNSPNTGATNESGFSALPGGYRSYNSDGTFNHVGNYGNWWSSTEYGSSIAYYHNLYYNSAGGARYKNGKSYGYSVRCVRD